MNKVNTLSNFSGCSPFFISSSISSLLFGKMNRDNQLENTEERIAFQKQLTESRKKFEDEKFDQELRFKREMLETGRFYQQIEAKTTDYHSRENVLLATPDNIKTDYGYGTGNGNGDG